MLRITFAYGDGEYIDIAFNSEDMRLATALKDDPTMKHLGAFDLAFEAKDLLDFQRAVYDRDPTGGKPHQYA